MTRKSNKRLVSGAAVQAQPDCCPFCDGRRIIKRGVRRNSFRSLQIYCCKDCERYFAPLTGLRGVKYPPRMIARALCLYHLGLSQEETAQRIFSEQHLRVPRRTVANWIDGYRSITTFHRLRPAAVHQFGCDMLRDLVLYHRQEYHFKIHLAKLALAASAVPPYVALKVKNYLRSVFGDFPHHLFREEETADGAGRQATAALRSSKTSFETLPFARTAKENLANDLAALGLLLARKNKDRHPSIQDFMLATDSCTIACEVPVYLTAEEIAYYRAQGFFVALPESAKPVTGHIDVVQMRNGLIHLLDYKPNARDIDPVNQLIVYALAFASRTRLPVRLFKCAWFDERDYFEFFPLEAVRPRARRDAPVLCQGNSFLSPQIHHLDDER